MKLIFFSEHEKITKVRYIFSKSHSQLRQKQKVQKEKKKKDTKAKRPNFNNCWKTSATNKEIKWQKSHPVGLWLIWAQGRHESAFIRVCTQKHEPTCCVLTKEWLTQCWHCQPPESAALVVDWFCKYCWYKTSVFMVLMLHYKHWVTWSDLPDRDRMNMWKHFSVKGVTVTGKVT